jgi:CBS domain-containing protein
MPIVQDILALKGSHVHRIAPETSVLQAIHQMNRHKVGAMLVMQASEVVGIFTERDVLRRVIGETRSPADVTVAEVMTTEVICCTPTTDLDEISAIMQEKRIRHVPCFDDGRLCGMISIGDINAYHVSQHVETINQLSDYICGRA